MKFKAMINLQNARSPIMEGIHVIHDWLMVFLVSISRVTLFGLLAVKINTFIQSSIDNHRLEFIWTVVPAIMLFAIVFPSLKLLYLLDERCGYSFKTIGHQWYWQYDLGPTYDSYICKGYRLLRVDNSLHVPLSPINMLVTSGDVLHSWAIPSLGVKADAVPGRINKAALISKKVGVYYGQCREICGRNHRFMPIVMECAFNWTFILKIKSWIVKICILFQLLRVVLRVAFYTLVERKILGYIQLRKGPNKPGFAGILVPLRDAVKLLKESNQPRNSNKIIFNGTPIFSLFLAVGLWAAYPSFSFKYSFLWFLCFTAIGVYALLGAGWSRNSKYTLLGAVRSLAQSISYEVSLSFLLLHFVLFWNFEFFRNNYEITFLTHVVLLLFITLLAETNRSPFDFAEGESELVSGFNTEFRGVPFMMIFLSEYMTILFISMVLTTFMHHVFVPTVIWGLLFLWARGTLPRLRYDQLIGAAWKSFLPFSLCSLILFLI